MDADRVERLIAQVLEESRAFRQEANERISSLVGKVTALDEKVTAEIKFVREELHTVQRELGVVKGDVAFMKLAISEHSRAIAELRGDVGRIETKLDAVVADHGPRLDKLEGK